MRRNKFVFFINCYKVINLYLRNIHFHPNCTKYRHPCYLRVKQTKLHFKIYSICIYLLNTYKYNLEIFNL